MSSLGSYIGRLFSSRKKNQIAPAATTPTMATANTTELVQIPLHEMDRPTEASVLDDLFSEHNNAYQHCVFVLPEIYRESLSMLCRLADKFNPQDHHRIYYTTADSHVLMQCEYSPRHSSHRIKLSFANRRIRKETSYCQRGDCNIEHWNRTTTLLHSGQYKKLRIKCDIDHTLLDNDATTASGKTQLTQQLLEKLRLAIKLAQAKSMQVDIQLITARHYSKRQFDKGWNKSIPAIMAALPDDIEPYINKKDMVFTGNNHDHFHYNKDGSRKSLKRQHRKIVYTANAAQHGELLVHFDDSPMERDEQHLYQLNKQLENIGSHICHIKMTRHAELTPSTRQYLNEIKALQLRKTDDLDSIASTDIDSDDDSIALPSPRQAW